MSRKRSSRARLTGQVVAEKAHRSSLNQRRRARGGPTARRKGTRDHPGSAYGWKRQKTLQHYCTRRILHSDHTQTSHATGGSSSKRRRERQQESRPQAPTSRRLAVKFPNLQPEEGKGGNFLEESNLNNKITNNGESQTIADAAITDFPTLVPKGGALGQEQ